MKLYILMRNSDGVWEHIYTQPISALTPVNTKILFRYLKNYIRKNNNTPDDYRFITGHEILVGRNY